MTAQELRLAATGAAFITCGDCGSAAQVEDWVRSRLGVLLVRGTYQCPACRHAFRRVRGRDELGRAVVRLVRCQAVL